MGPSSPDILRQTALESRVEIDFSSSNLSTRFPQHAVALSGGDMTLGSRRIIPGVVVMAALWVLSVGLVAGQLNRPIPGLAQPTKPRPPATEQNQMLAENAFINIQALKGIPA